MKTANIYFSIMIVLAASFGCGSSIPLTSSHRTENIIVDGNDDDWKNISTFTEKNNAYSLNVCNDSNYLFLCLTLHNRRQAMSVMRTGLILWFDNEEGGSKKFGINYPLGRHGEKPSAMSEERGRSPETMPEQLQRDLMEMDILGKKESDKNRIPVFGSEGLKVKINFNSKEEMVYELQVPLRKDRLHPFAIGAESNSKIGIGIETPEIRFDKEKMGQRPEGGMGEFGGGAPPMENGVGGGRRGGGRRPPENAMEFNRKENTIQQWFTIQLTQ